MKLFQLFKLTFAVLSLTDILVYQKIAAPIREYFGWEHEQGDPIGWEPTPSRVKNFFGNAIGCPRCTSVWAALILIILSKFPGYGEIEGILISSWIATYINRKSF